MNDDQEWMRRALMLAEYGRGYVSPNPMVGCVIVHENKIIGEGWHRQYGGPHAEVWAVKDAEKRSFGHLLEQATVYVTLEPCSHTGKTPPCADLLVRKKVKRVVVCIMDPNPLVSGRGIDRLRNAGIEVTTDVLPEAGRELNKRFLTGILKRRPYVILKWAETADGALAEEDNQPVRITCEASNILVHKWRAEEDAILVGYKTAISDDPRLNVRNWHGINPVRIVLDRHMKLPGALNLFDKTQPTIVVTYGAAAATPVSPERYGDAGVISFVNLQPGPDEIGELLSRLAQRGIQSVLVEGGATILKAFLSVGYWDEIRRCQAPLVIGKGIKAPNVQGVLRHAEKLGVDLWSYYIPAVDPL